MSDPIKVVIQGSVPPRLQTLFKNPQNFTVLGASDVNAPIQINGQVLTWNSSSKSFNLETPSNSINVVNIGGNYILSTQDSGTIIGYNNTNPLIINTSNSILTSTGGSIGFNTTIYQLNTGSVTIQAGPGTVLLPKIIANNKISGQNASVSIISFFANTFILEGSIG